MKRLTIFLTVLAFFMATAGELRAQRRTTVQMGTLMEGADTLGEKGRRLSQRLFISKGELGMGMQFSYLDLSSGDSEILMLIRNLNAYGTSFSVTPYFAYAVKDNHAVGLKLRVSKTDAGISSADLSLLSDDLSLSVEDVQGHSNSLQSSVFYRSYVGLDPHGRFGLFSDLSLGYTHSKTSYTYNSASLDAFTVSDKLKLGIHPGLEVFIMNNVSTHFSIGIGGISYTRSKYYRNDEPVGTRDVSKARFMLDITDISMGLTIHI